MVKGGGGEVNDMVREAWTLLVIWDPLYQLADHEAEECKLKLKDWAIHQGHPSKMTQGMIDVMHMVVEAME